MSGALESPDGTLTITDEQGASALASFHQSDREQPIQEPDVQRRNLLRQARLAGHLGGAMGLTEDQTLTLWMSNPFFRQWVWFALASFDEQARREKADQS